MPVLFLPIKKKWFDMIQSGEKTEEYRNLNVYWATRMMGGFPSIYGIDMVAPDWKRFDAICLMNGYASKSPRIHFTDYSFRIGEGRPEWGAEPGKKYFVITLKQKM